MQTINEDIKNGTFKPVYLLYGEEAFLKQSYKKKLRAAISGDDTMNYNYFEGKGLDVNEADQSGGHDAIFQRAASDSDRGQRIFQDFFGGAGGVSADDAGHDLHRICGGGGR